MRSCHDVVVIVLPERFVLAYIHRKFLIGIFVFDGLFIDPIVVSFVEIIIQDLKSVTVIVIDSISADFCEQHVGIEIQNYHR